MLFSRPAASSGANFGAWVVPATAEPLGVARRAATRPGSGRGRECGSWSHRLLSGEPTDEDHPPLLTVRTDHRLDRRHRLCIGRHKWRNDRLLWRIELGWRLELQHLPHPRAIVALRGMPQTEVSDLVEAARQHVLEEAAHELLAAEPARPRLTGLAVLELDGDRFVVEADDACVGESDTKDVAGEVVEHGLFAFAPGGDMQDPGPPPHRLRDDEIRALSL